MKNSIKKRQQKIVRKVSRTTAKVGAKGKNHLKQNFFARISHIENIRLLIFEWGLLVCALIMLAVTQAFWFADSYAEDRFSEGGTFSEGTVGTVATLNPLFATTSSEKTLSSLLFATLATNDYSGHPGTGLAESITSSENGKVWTIKLHEGLKWSDGLPITNEDVIWSINTIKNPIVKSIYDANLAGVEASENENGEIVLTLPQPYTDFISALNFPVLPKHKLETADLKNLAEHEFSVNPVTSGPFQFNAFQSGVGDEKVYYLSSNPNYYKGEPLLDSFAIHTYSSRDALIKALNSGAVTASAELTDAESEAVSSSGLAKKNASLNSGTYLFFNTARDSVANREMRQAIRQGLNLDAMRDVAVDTTPLDYPLLSSQIELENWPAIPDQDLDAARAKIGELTGGLAGQPLSDENSEQAISLEIATVSSGFMPAVADQLSDQLENLGFKTNVTVYDPSQRDFLTNRAYDILIYKIGLGADPDLLPYYHSLYTGANGLNLSNYKNSLTDDLLLGARNTKDDNLKNKKYETFLNYWVNDVPAIGLYQSNMTYFYNKNARTFGNNVRLVTETDRFVDVEDWAVNKTSKYRTP